MLRDGSKGRLVAEKGTDQLRTDGIEAEGEKTSWHVQAPLLTSSCITGQPIAAHLTCAHHSPSSTPSDIIVH